MEGLFSGILRMSVRACWAIAAVLLARLLLRRAPKRVICALWLLPALRLCCPLFPEAWFSLLPRRSAFSLPLLQTAPAGSGMAGAADLPGAAVGSPPPFPASIPAYLWLAGVCLMLAYALVSWLRLKRRVAASLAPGKDIRVCDEAESPFILGVFRPAIYLPSALDEPDREYVLAHERAHLRRWDHLWKPLGWLLLGLHWFNPLCWPAYILFCRDMEAACDEEVVRDLDREGQAAYAQALLDCAFPGRRFAACPLAFGETGVKGRVKGILNYRRPRFWVILAAVILCAVLAMGFLTDPARLFSADAEVKSAFYCSLIQTPDNSVEYIRLTPEQAEELRDLLLRSGRRASFYYGQMYLAPDSQVPDNSLSCSVDLNFTDGTHCQVLYAYYSGYSFLRGREDDYYARVCVFGRGKARFWIMSEDFDEAFGKWRQRLLAGLREAEAGAAE